jgi:hypothetical protein
MNINTVADANALVDANALLLLFLYLTTMHVLTRRCSDPRSVLELIKHIVEAEDHAFVAILLAQQGFDFKVSPEVRINLLCAFARHVVV